jgi:hypothetical protein
VTLIQIQLPDETFDHAKKLCEAREMSLAELARRGIEYILIVCCWRRRWALQGKQLQQSHEPD